MERMEKGRCIRSPTRYRRFFIICIRIGNEKKKQK